MTAYNTFNKILHLSRSGCLLQSIHNGQQNFLYEISTSAMLIFSKCVYLINVVKCKFGPNETIIMYDLSSSNFLSLYNLFLLTETLVKHCTYPPPPPLPLVNKKVSSVCLNKVIITILLTFVGFGSM